MNYRLVRAACAALFLPCVALAASTADATTTSTSTQAKESRPQDPLEPALNSPESRTLYTLGQLISRTLDGFALTTEELRFVRQGLEDGVLGKPPKVDLAAEADGLHTLQAARRAATLQREKQAAEAFLKQVTTAPNVARLDNGVILQPLAAGHGAVPTPADQVSVHYEGALVDGTVFDSSRQRGQPATLPVKGVIPCWTSALQQMRVGARTRIVCPPELAYGERGAPPTIKPGATLVFDIELLAIVR